MAIDHRDAPDEIDGVADVRPLESNPDPSVREGDGPIERT
jgi:hypothetical protein